MSHVLPTHMYRQHPSVKQLFDEEFVHYLKLGQVKSAVSLTLFSRWIKRYHIRRRLSICEFGGGGGPLLKLIKELYPNSVCTNVEISESYRAKNPKGIKFLQGSVLDSGFEKNTYDVLIMRDVLHHLVGDTFRESRQNQRHALDELWRIVRPGGVIIIEEYTHDSSLASILTYWLTRINMTLGIRIPKMQISPHANVAFLTPSAFLSLCEYVFEKRNISVIRDIPIKTELASRIVHLGATLRRVSVVVEKSII